MTFLIPCRFRIDLKQLYVVLAGVHAMVMTRDRINHYKKSDRVKHHPKQHQGEAMGDDINEGAVYFRPGMAPTQRQIYYQVYICGQAVLRVRAPRSS